MDFLQSLFDISGYPARLQGGVGWTEHPAWGWAAFASDLAIWAAYSAIPLVLLFTVSSRRRAALPKLVYLFAAFLLLGGTVHLIDAVIFYQPIYRLSALANMITAVVAWCTVLSLFSVVPALRKFRLPEEAERIIRERTQRITALMRQAQRDAEEKQAINEQLTNSRELLQLAFSAGGTGFFNWHLQSNVIEVDAGFARLTGLGLSGMRIHPDEFFSRVPSPHRERVSEAVQLALETGQTFHAEFPYSRHDGSSIWLSGRGTFIRDEAGNLVRMIGLNTDITAHIEREQGLDAAARTAVKVSEHKSRFIAQVSHEIRTPLTAMLGCIDTLLPNLREDDARDLLRVVRSQGELLRILLNDVLDLTKVEAGKLELNPQRTSLAPVFAGVCSLMEPLAAEKDIQLRWVAETRLPRQVHIDPYRLRQVLLNLVHNAIKFTREGSVTIRVRLDRIEGNSMLGIDVRDTGVGIPREKLQQIFREFEQVGRDEGGTGLGLAIANRLVEMMDGRLAVASEVGLGSVFTVKVPLGPVAADELEDFDQLVSVEPGVEEFSQLEERPLPMRVLVAEDTRVIRFVLERLLGKLVDEFHIVSDGRQAVIEAMAAEEGEMPYDLILMDVQMPEIDGIEATRQLRREGFDKPIVALTAATQSDDRERCLAAGFTDFLPKPLDVRRIRETLTRYLPLGSDVPV